MDFTFVSGNEHKIRYLELWLGQKVKHHKLDLVEIQSLDPRVVVEYKVKEAYKLIGTPVLVEDISVEFDALRRLPGTLIKWFLEELGNEGLCKLVGAYEDRSATARVIYGLYNGTEIHFFEGTTRGSIAPEPRGTHGFGWNQIFIPEGMDKTYAEIPDDTMGQYNHRAVAVKKLREYLLLKR